MTYYSASYYLLFFIINDDCVCWDDGCMNIHRTGDCDATWHNTLSHSMEREKQVSVKTEPRPMLTEILPGRSFHQCIGNFVEQSCNLMDCCGMSLAFNEWQLVLSSFCFQRGHLLVLQVETFSFISQNNSFDVLNVVLDLQSVTGYKQSIKYMYYDVSSWWSVVRYFENLPFIYLLFIYMVNLIC